MDIFTHISLFTGYGGLDLGLKMVIPNLRTILYCDIERYSQGCLISRMQDGTLDPAPIWDDIRTLDGRPWRGRVDIISGGFPCKDTSIAKSKYRKGFFGEQSGLWKEYARLIGEIQPRFALMENPTGLDSIGLGELFADLAEINYDAISTVISASSVGADHIRKRRFILAYPVGERFSLHTTTGRKISQSVGYEYYQEKFRGEWPSEYQMDREPNGTPCFMDCIKLLGNGVVPQQAALAFQILSERLTNDIPKS